MNSLMPLVDRQGCKCWLVISLESANTQRLPFTELQISRPGEPWSYLWLAPLVCCLLCIFSAPVTAVRGAHWTITKQCTRGCVGTFSSVGLYVWVVKSLLQWLGNTLVKSLLLVGGALHCKTKIKELGRSLALSYRFTFHFLCPWRLS